MVKILEGLKRKINNHMPRIRRPGANAHINQFNNEYGSFFKYRNKSVGVGWNTYYKAMSNVWVNACIQTYIDEIINLGFTIKDPNTEIVNKAHVDYYTKFFKKPMGSKSNYTYSIYQSLMWKSYLGLGDAFSEVIYGDYKTVPVGLKYIPAEFMRYYTDTSQWGFYDDSYRFETEELIHVKDPGIYDGVWGESKIDVIAREINLELLAEGHTLNMLENGGFSPNGVIEYSDNIKPQELKLEMARLQAEAENSESGVLVLRGANYKSLGFSNKDMEYEKLINRVRDCIIATYGVPPAKVSIIETANLGSGSGNAQDKQFKKTLKGKAKNFEDAFTTIIGRSGFNEIFQYNDLDIEDKLQRAQIENIKLNNKTLTINEVRKGYGQEPVPWGEEP